MSTTCRTMMASPLTEFYRVDTTPGGRKPKTM